MCGHDLASPISKIEGDQLVGYLVCDGCGNYIRERVFEETYSVNPNLNPPNHRIIPDEEA